MEQFLGIVLSIILGFYLLGKIGKFMFRYWLARKMKQFGDKGQFGGFDFRGFTQNGGFSSGNRDNYTGGDEKKKEGKVTISGSVDRNKRVKERVGEYVDYEDLS